MSQLKAAVKRRGKHCTPPALADFLAERVLRQIAASGREELRVLDEIWEAPCGGVDIARTSPFADLGDLGQIRADLDDPNQVWDL